MFCFLYTKRSFGFGFAHVCREFVCLSLCQQDYTKKNPVLIQEVVQFQSRSVKYEKTALAPFLFILWTLRTYPKAPDGKAMCS